MKPSTSDNSKTTLADLMLKVKELDQQYSIPQFQVEVDKTFEKIHLTYAGLNSMVFQNDPTESTPPSDVTDADIESYIKKYESLKKKYNFEKYIKAGHQLRKKFLRERKTYLFNNIKIVTEMDTKKTNAYEKLSIDYSEQFFIARWIDKILDKITPNTLVLTYEDTDSKIKTIEIMKKDSVLTEDFVEAPLIDRIVGATIFDSFLLHSFYNVAEKQWQYVPTKLIIAMEHKANAPSQKE